MLLGIAALCWACPSEYNIALGVHGVSLAGNNETAKKNVRLARAQEKKAAAELDEGGVLPIAGPDHHTRIADLDFGQEPGQKGSRALSDIHVIGPSIRFTGPL